MLQNSFIAWYLFLGGLGAGLFVAAGLAFLAAHYNAPCWAGFVCATWKPSLIGSFAVLLVACLCLLKDLGVPAEALLLFAKPTFSAVSVGALALALLLLCLMTLIVVDVRYLTFPRVRFVLFCAAMVLSVVVMAYTGVLLLGIAAVPLWGSIFLPALFVLSSLSSGMAGLILIALFQKFGPMLSDAALRCVRNLDSAVIILEAFVVLFMGVQLALGGESAALGALAFGELRWQFWLGFLGCGILIPLLLSFIERKVATKSPVLPIASGCLILIGAFYLRYCMIFGVTHASAYLFA